MITEKDNVFYCDCGFSFERGRSGHHECGDGLRAKLELFRTAFMEYSDKTDWVQTDKRFDVIKPWGKHRADVLREFIEHLESKLVAAESGFPPLTVERLIREKGALEKRVSDGPVQQPYTQSGAETRPAAKHCPRAGLRLCGGATFSGEIAERVGPKA